MKFKNKPKIIDALQFDGSEDSYEYIRAYFNMDHKAAGRFVFSSFDIKTTEGPLKVSPKDWVIKGHMGEFYSRKPDAFERSYEPLDDTPKENTQA